jgi:hypothetical protein
MNTRRVLGVVVLAIGVASAGETPVRGQCCLTDLFAGCGSCFRKPAYAVAPVVAPVAAPIAAPVVAAPMMVPMQQTSYVPETTYRTQYQCVPVTTYKPSCEVDPCTGCTRECMQPVTQYVQQAVNVPVTQYRAVTTTKYVQMPPGYAGGGYPAAVPAVPGQAAATPFAAPVQTTPQAWGAAGADVPQQFAPGTNPPALPAAPVPQPTFQPITPQAGTYAPAPPSGAAQPQSTTPPALTPTPSLKPIPELPRTGSGNVTAPAVGTAPSAPADTGKTGMPVLPGSGPNASTHAFPRLLEPTGHTTSWQPSTIGAPRAAAYPTAALPGRPQVDSPRL